MVFDQDLLHSFHHATSFPDHHLSSDPFKDERQDRRHKHEDEDKSFEKKLQGKITDLIQW